jgi:lysophospholipase L1-like esterase
MRIRKLALRVGLFAVGLALALGSAELVLRAVGFEFQLYPSKVQFGWPDPAAIRRLYHVDQQLLWVPKDYDEQVAKAIATPPKHVLMGCSCTEHGRYDVEFKKLVDARHAGHSYSFVNLGVGGWSTYQGRQQMQRDTVRIKPKLVTIYYGWNDHWATLGIEDKHIGQYNLEQSHALTWLSDRSRVAQLLNKTVFRGEFQGLTREKRVSLPDFRTNLESMVTLAREAGIVPVLLTAPSAHQQGDEPVYLSLRWLHDRTELVPLHKAYADVVREVAAKHDVHLVDLFEAFAALDRETLVGSFKVDGVHLNEAGDKRIAELLYSSLESAGLLSLLVD